MRPSADPSRDVRLVRHLAAILDDPAASIAFVWPMWGEPDLRPLMQRFAAADRTLLLPAITAPGQPLEFRPWTLSAAMQAGPCHTAHPRPSGVPARDPDIILVPLLAFDRRRNRLGRGGGFYDRTLAARPAARAIGFAHATAEIDSVPTGPHDRRLDAIVTDQGSF